MNKLNKTNLKSPLINANLVSQKYITNSNVWTVDETFFSSKYVAFIVINLKTRCILSYGTKKLTVDNNQNVIKNNNVIYKVGFNSDEILSVYQETIQCYNKPEKIHSDNNPTYFSNSIYTFAKDYNIKLSQTNTERHSNQVSEAVNNALKSYFITAVHRKNRRNYKAFRLQWPDKFKNLLDIKRRDNKQFREMFFESHFFKNEINFLEFFEEAVNIYNNKICKALDLKQSRLKTEEYNNHIITTGNEEATSKDNHSKQIIRRNNEAYKVVATFKNFVNTQESLSTSDKEHLNKKFKVFQDITPLKDRLNEIFLTAPEEQKLVLETILLTYQDQLETTKVIKQTNDDLVKKLNIMQKQNNEYTKIIDTLNEYVEKIKQNEEIKRLLKEKKDNQVSRQQTQPFFHEHYEIVLKWLNDNNNSNYEFITILRTKVVLAIFMSTGLRVTEIRQIKVSQVLTLIRKGYIAIDRVKRGPSNKKAYLTPEGKKYIKQSFQDIFLLMKFTGIKVYDEALDSYDVEEYKNTYLFSSTKNKGTKPLTRPHFTDTINKLLQQIPEFKNKDKNFTSHSFRHGFITKLWNNTGDIKFVKDVIGHTNIQTTLKYADHINEEDIQKRMNNIKEQK